MITLNTLKEVLYYVPIFGILPILLLVMAEKASRRCRHVLACGLFGLTAAIGIIGIIIFKTISQELPLRLSIIIPIWLFVMTAISAVTSYIEFWGGVMTKRLGKRCEVCAVLKKSAEPSS